jgi:hypothetical protein
VSIVVFRAREIVTLDRNCPSAEAVAVWEGKILHVGTIVEVTDALAGKEFTFDDRFLDHVIVPGFIEAHGHLYNDGLLSQLIWCGFDDRPLPNGRIAKGSRNIAEVLERLRHDGDDTVESVVGYGFDPSFLDGQKLHRHDLDAVSTTQGVLVVNASGHLCYANSTHMKRCGVDASTDVRGVVKDETGEPTGEFHETAMALVMNFSGAQTTSTETAVRGGAELLRRAGVTTGSDMSLFASGRTFETYREIMESPGVPVRVTYSPNIEDMRSRMSPEALLPLMKDLRSASNERFTLGPLKWIADGSIQGYTGALKWPGYCGGDDHGFLILNEDDVIEKITPFHNANFQIAIHTNGDDATEVVLRALERVLIAAPRPDHRHRLEHCQMASPAMMRRMAAMGVAANIFSNHIYYWGDIHRTRTMGFDKSRRMDAAATALREGVAISLHSDHPVTPVSPLFTMWCAVNRVTRSGHVQGEGERITANEALAAVTLGSAILMKRDEMLGSIEVGKWADFTVLAENPLRVDPMKIKDIAVVATVLAGEATTPWTGEED